MGLEYHAGELEVQERAGAREKAERVRGIVRPALMRDAREFLLDQPMLVVGSVGAAGRVWASPLAGEPGFARALDERTVLIGARPAPGDPLNENLTLPGAPVGILAIELQSRRRIRLNGRAYGHPEGLLVRVEQAYGNCPKYIQARRWETVGEGPGAVAAEEVRRGRGLTEEQRSWISSSDTFFIASTHPEGGTDASHRGGLPGFVRLVDENTLEFPDYPGNSMFNTLGNIAANPNAGLLFVDFEGGGTLQLSGRARILWEGERADSTTGRVVRFEAEEVVEIKGAVPLCWRFEAYSPFNPRS